MHAWVGWSTGADQAKILPKATMYVLAWILQLAALPDTNHSTEWAQCFLYGTALWKKIGKLKFKKS